MGTLCPYVFCFAFGVRCTHTAFDCGLEVEVPSPVRRLDLLQTSGGVRRGLFEHVDAQRIVRVPQPRLFAIDQGNPAGAVNRGRLFLGYFLFGEAKESD